MKEKKVQHIHGMIQSFFDKVAPGGKTTIVLAVDKWKIYVVLPDGYTSETSVDMDYFDGHWRDVVRKICELYFENIIEKILAK